jgi:NADH-quinone oxidoreductase subunit C
MEGVAILARLAAEFGGDVLETHTRCGDATAVIAPAAIDTVLRFCRDDPALAFDMLMDLTAVDYLRYPGREDGRRYEVVYHLYSTREHHRVRVKVALEEDRAVVPTAVPVWAAANWFEREVWDMFGIRFEGHPDLRRLLLYDEFVGHPLRKDYPINRRQPLIGPRN